MPGKICQLASSHSLLVIRQTSGIPEVRHFKPDLPGPLVHQTGEGDLIRWCEACLPWIGEIQVADNPGRCEPGTGEIAYDRVARALDRMGYRGPVGMEAFAAGDSDAALDAFVAAFTL